MYSISISLSLSIHIYIYTFIYASAISATRSAGRARRRDGQTARRAALSPPIKMNYTQFRSQVFPSLDFFKGLGCPETLFDR